MGKHHLIKLRAAFDDDDDNDDDTARHKQPAGCVWGLFRVLNYHHWQHNPKTVIGQTDPNKPGDSFQKMSSHEVEIEKLLEEMDPNLFLNKTRRRTRREKKPLRERIKALIAKEGSSSRTYSIRRLENLRNRLAKLLKILNRGIGFLGNNTEIETKMKPDDAYTPCNNEPAHKPADVLEIFKVDKDLLVEHLQDADESLANFSRSALRLGLNPSAIFGKSRSFPRHQRRMKFKPTKLENKKIEVWSYLERDKLQAVIKGCDYTVGRYHRRSLSSTESLDKYATLYEKSFVNDPKLQHSKSSRVGKSESDISVPAHFRRLSSMSNVDSYDSFEVPRNEYSRTTVTVKETNSVLEDMKQGEEDNTVMGRGEESKMDVNETIDVITERVRTTRENEDVENVKIIDVESDKTVQSNLAFELGEVDASDKEIHDHSSTLNCNNPNDTEPDTEMSNEALTTKIYSSDLNYIRHLLDRSCIALNASERAWHAYDQPLSPRLLEEEHSSNCCHRQMLFDYVNEKLVEIYDMSLPYYPKPLSLNCHVLTFPRGNRIVDEVLKSVGSSLDLSSGEEQSSLDRIVARDFAKDRNWMNLQMESEMKALEIEDTIFQELVEEIIYYFLKFN